jgi:PPOX class probable F420-dependent enzyme
MTTLEQLGSEKYVLLTTFRKDGRAVPTPLWVVADDGGLAFWTTADSGKVKRIRNGGRVTMQACEMRGAPKDGAPVVEGQARIGDAADRTRVAKSLGKKYGLLGRVTQWGSRIRRGVDGTVVVLVS